MLLSYSDTVTCYQYRIFSVYVIVVMGMITGFSICETRIISDDDPSRKYANEIYRFCE